MKVYELVERLNKVNQNMDVNIEVNIDGVDFCCGIDDLYESGDIYAHATFGTPEHYKVVDTNVVNPSEATLSSVKGIIGCCKESGEGEIAKVVAYEHIRDIIARAEKK